MGKVINRVGAMINWLAYIWLVTSEALEEMFYGTIGDSLRGIFSKVETRQHAAKVEPRILSRPNTAAKVADTL